jgi:hypothetical protein
MDSRSFSHYPSHEQAKHVTTSWLIVIFGEMERSRSMSWYYKR